MSPRARGTSLSQEHSHGIPSVRRKRASRPGPEYGAHERGSLGGKTRRTPEAFRYHSSAEVPA